MEDIKSSNKLTKDRGGEGERPFTEKLKLKIETTCIDGIDVKTAQKYL